MYQRHNGKVRRVIADDCGRECLKHLCARCMTARLRTDEELTDLESDVARYLAGELDPTTDSAILSVF